MSEVRLNPNEFLFFARFVYVSDKESGTLTPSKTSIHSQMKILPSFFSSLMAIWNGEHFVPSMNSNRVDLFVSVF